MLFRVQAVGVDTVLFESLSRPKGMCIKGCQLSAFLYKRHFGGVGILVHVQTRMH